MMTAAALSPYIAVSDAAAAITFYVDALGAEERFRLVDPTDGRIGHAQLDFGDASLMISDEYPDFGALSPGAVGGTPVKLHLYVDDVDAVFAAAIERGAMELRPVKGQFHGDRSGMLVDPFGHMWFIATKGEIVTPEEMQARWSATIGAEEGPVAGT